MSTPIPGSIPWSHGQCPGPTGLARTGIFRPSLETGNRLIQNCRLLRFESDPCLAGRIWFTIRTSNPSPRSPRYEIHSSDRRCSFPGHPDSGGGWPAAQHPRGAGGAHSAILAFVKPRTRTSTRCTASCSCATATSSPRAGGRRTTPDSARAVLAEQELHLHGRRPGHRRGEAEHRRPGAQVLPRRRARRRPATI